MSAPTSTFSVGWEKVTNSLQGKGVKCLHSFGNYLYAGTYNNGIVFATEDDGENWGQVSDVLKDNGIQCLYSSKDYLYAGTRDGFWKIKIKHQTKTPLSILAGSMEEHYIDL